MYIVRRRNSAKNVAFKTFDGWAEHDSTKIGDVLELGDVMRFTEREAELNRLRPDEDWVWFGCYRRLQ